LLLSTRPPPAPPLFPYTTLFRSDYGDDTNRPEARTRAQTARSGTVQSGRRPGSQAPWDNGEIRSRVVADVVDRRRLLLHPARIGDRKSTRLNSSHRTISYAVFCL